MCPTTVDGQEQRRGRGINENSLIQNIIPAMYSVDMYNNCRVCLGNLIRVASCLYRSVPVICIWSADVVIHVCILARHGHSHFTAATN